MELFMLLQLFRNTYIIYNIYYILNAMDKQQQLLHYTDHLIYFEGWLKCLMFAEEMWQEIN